jgi:hypothetical protein
MIGYKYQIFYLAISALKLKAGLIALDNNIAKVHSRFFDLKALYAP